MHSNGYICQYIHIFLKYWEFHVLFHAIEIVLEVYLVFHIMYAILTELKILKNKFQSYIYIMKDLSKHVHNKGKQNAYTLILKY